MIQTAAVQPLESRSRQPRSALLIEDSPDFVRLLHHMLKPWNLEVLAAGSVAAATAFTQARTFDLYLIGLQLADGDSSDLIATLATNGLDSRCVVVTAFSMISRAFTSLPLVDKGHLETLASHLTRILGAPETVREEAAR